MLVFYETGTLTSHKGNITAISREQNPDGGKKTSELSRTEQKKKSTTDQDTDGTLIRKFDA